MRARASDRRRARRRPAIGTLPRPGGVPAGPAAVLLLGVALLPVLPLAAQSSGDGDAGGDARPSDHADRQLVPDTARSAGSTLQARSPSSLTPWPTRAAGLVMLLATDVGLQRAVQDLRQGPGPLSRHGSVGEEIAGFGNDLGAWKTSLPYLAVGTVAVGAAADGLRGAGRGLSVLGGVAAGTMATVAVNHAVGRSRPAWREGVLSFDPFSGHTSFPSGHVSLAFSLAGGVDAVTDGWLPSAAAYTVAGTTAFARVYSDRHWLSDVVVGAVLSATVSRLATRRTMELLGVGKDVGPGQEASGASGTGLGRSRTADRVRSPRIRLLFTPSLLGAQLRF